MSKRAPLVHAGFAVIAISALLVSFFGCGLDSGGTLEEAPEKCLSDASCEDGNPCTTNTCTIESGKCESVALTLDLPTQTAGDCSKNVCQDGVAATIADDIDVQDDLEDCTVDSCQDGTPKHVARADGDTCHIGDAEGTCDAGACVVTCSASNPVCPDDGNPCTEDNCDIGTGECTYGPLDGVPVPGVVEQLDCMVHRCVAGQPTDLIDDTELPDDQNDCTSDLCMLGSPSNPPLDLNDSCAGGTYFCDGQGNCGECNTGFADVQCPFTAPCEVATCSNQTCGIMNVAQGDTMAPTQLAGDCHIEQCDGQGAQVSVVDNNDLPNDSNDCTNDICTAGVPSHTNTAPLSLCNGTGQCDGAGTCKNPLGGACAAGTDCGSGFCVDSSCCTTSSCTTCKSCNLNGLGTCSNVAANQDDPGSCSGTSSCDGAANCKLDPGAACSTGSQCLSGNCVDSVCCGTSTCPTCQSCNLNGAGTCSNVAANQDDVGSCSGTNSCDGAGNCKVDQGAACAQNSDCLSAFCVDGVCCNAVCNTTCQACSATKKGSGADGVCGSIGNNLDPDNECPTNTCKTGTCNGAGVCGDSSSATTCNGGTSCAAGVQVNQDTCNGAGTCTDNGTTNCAPYVCGASLCKTTCTVDADCSTGNYCSGTTCVAKKADGVACSGGAGNQCISNNCIDGVCCNNSCGALCQACNVAGSVGTCANVPTNSDPANECSTSSCTTGNCNGAGACGNQANGFACGSALSCSGTIQTNQDTCNGSGTCTENNTTSCVPYVCGATACKTTCANDNDCSSGNWCMGTTCVAKKGNGVGCAGGNECTSTFCADGVCCSGLCNGACQACTAVKKGSGSDGTCGNIALNTDPDNECATVACKTGTCDGFGACGNLAGGTACGDLQSCANGTVTNADFCGSGGTAGTCIDNGTAGCSPYVCSGNNLTCLPNCAVNADCASGFACDVGSSTCVLVLAQGATCTLSAQCPGGNCVDGVCCNTTCTGTCMSCDAVGGTPGTCANVPTGFGDNTCLANEACNAVQMCKTAVGMSCSSDPMCASGICSTNCISTFFQPCIANPDCDAGLACAVDATYGKVCKTAAGGACTLNSQCANGTCTGGTTCN